MSHENVEIARALLARWERGDYDTAAAFDPLVEFTRTGGGSDILGYGTESRGIDGLRAALAAWTDEWTDVSVRAEGFTEAGSRVLVLARHRAVGRHSGMPMSNLDAWVFSFRGGRIVRWDAYWDPADARRALGIEARPENLEVVRDQYAATNERDFGRAMAHYDADVVLIVPPGFVDPGTYRGRDAVGAWFGDWFRSFDRDARFELRELSELGGGAVLLVADHHARGRGSGVEVHQTLVWVYVVRAGKIARVEGHTTRSEALRAAGPAE